MIGRYWLLMLCVAVPAALATADEPKTPPATSGPAAKATPPLRLDLKARQITLDAVVAQRQVSLEFLLCTRGTKDYESLLATSVKPSVLHAALLALNLRPGKPGRWSEGEGKEPTFLPPAGAKLTMKVRWTDAKGVKREARVSDWLIEASTQASPKSVSWVFVGSAILGDGSYWADGKGHHISLANFPSSVVDVPFASSDKKAMLEFTANPAKVPPAGAAVELVITPVAGAENAPDARIAFAIDSLGQIRMDGKAVLPEKIGGIVKAFLARHTRGAAEVVVDPRAMAFDRRRLADILADAGMTEVSFHTGRLTDEVLPRTGDEAARALAWWRKQLIEAGDQFIDPAEDAKGVLEHIRKRQKQIQALQALWGDYAAQLKRLVSRHAERAERGGTDDTN